MSILFASKDHWARGKATRQVEKRLQQGVRDDQKRIGGTGQKKEMSGRVLLIPFLEVNLVFKSSVVL
jgi:hypothetical protein